MSTASMDKLVATELYENNKPDEFSLQGKMIPLVISNIAYLDANGSVTVRLQVNRHPAEPSFDFAITPHAAIRLAFALADVVNTTGQYTTSMQVLDRDTGRILRLTPE